MNEKTLLRRLKRGDTAALEQVIDHYSSYTAAVIRSVIGKAMTAQDIEEVTADVFVVLWQQADRVEAGHLKGYLSSVARNKALNKLRERGETLELEEDILIPDDQLPERILTVKEQNQMVTSALLEMEQPDRDIFLRYYYYCQTVAQISQGMALNLSTVKSRLARGRKKLRKQLEKRGFIYENQ